MDEPLAEHTGAVAVEVRGSFCSFQICFLRRCLRRDGVISHQMQSKCAYPDNLSLFLRKEKVMFKVIPSILQSCNPEHWSLLKIVACSVCRGQRHMQHKGQHPHRLQCPWPFPGVVQCSRCCKNNHSFCVSDIKYRISFNLHNNPTL